MNQLAKRSPDQVLEMMPVATTTVRFQTRCRFTCIKGQNILFSPSRQAVFDLNDTAAYLWLSLKAGMSPEAIVSEMVRHGANPHDAESYVWSAIREWQTLDLIRPELSSFSGNFEDGPAQVVELSGMRFRIVYPKTLAFPAMAIFRHLETRAKVVDVVLNLVEHGDRIHMFRNDDWVASCSGEEVPTVVKGQLLGDVLARGNYEIALHAAALRRNDRVLLLCGEPGAGKTTLTLALAKTGFGYSGDDVAVLDSSGRGLGLPFAPAVKAGAWPILSNYFPDLDAMPVFRRPDRRRVRYLVPEEPVSKVPQEIGWVVLLNRNPRTTDPGLEPVETAPALRGLLNGSFARGRKLTGSAFEVLAGVVEKAEIYRLDYSRLEDAVELIQKTCR